MTSADSLFMPYPSLGKGLRVCFIRSAVLAVIETESPLRHCLTLHMSLLVGFWVAILLVYVSVLKTWGIAARCLRCYLF